MKHALIAIGLMLIASISPLLSQRSAIKGVVRSVDGNGIPGATIILRNLGDGEDIRGGSTDRDGNFQIQVKDGRYSLLVAKPGFVRDERVRTTLNPSLDFFSAQEVTIENGRVSPAPLVIHLLPQAVVTGTIFDEDGDPVERVLVHFYRHELDGEGSRLIQVAPSAPSDDRGYYRVAGLPAGSYYIVADKAGGGVPQFYPGELIFSRAVPVNLIPGMMLDGANIRLRREVGRHIRGKVLDEAGRPFPRAQVWAIPEGGEFEGVSVSRLLYHAEAQADTNGEFDIGALSELPSGTYRLRALGASDAAVAPSENGFMGLGPRGVQGGNAVLYGTGKVTIAGTDVESVQLQLQAGRTLHGVVHREDGKPVANAAILFQAERFAEAKLLGDFEALSDADGYFTFPYAWPVEFDISVLNLPPDTYLKEIVYGEQNLLQHRLDHTKRDDGVIEVVLGSATSISGTVRTSEGSIPRDVQVFAWPKEARPINAFPGVTTGDDGSFKLGSLGPGDYYVVSTESADIQLFRSPKFLAALSQHATSISLAPSSSKDKITLTLVSSAQLRELIAGLR